MVLGMTIDRLPASERAALRERLKFAVGKGFGGKAPFLKDERLKGLYNNAMSAMIQNFIEGDDASST